MRRKVDLLALLGYALVSFAYFGWRLLPHPGRVVLGSQNPAIYVWSFAWWPHALTSLTNPFVSHALYAPIGVNLAWTPSAPGLALAFSPVTLLAGPVVSYNVAGVLLPALSAWTGYLLCRYLTKSTWASLVGGYLFGFSTAVLRQVGPGNVNLSAVFLFPLVALVVIRHLRGELSGRGLAWRLGAILALQLTISTEFTALVTIALAVSLALAEALVRDVRPRMGSTLVWIAAAYGLAALLAAPFVYYLLAHFQSAAVVADVKLWGTDALAAVVPNSAIGIGGHDAPAFAGGSSSRSAYLGLPTLLILAAYAVRARRSAGARFALAAFAAAFVATLGATLQVDGHTLWTLPWWIAASHVPGLRDALPFRLGILEALAAAVIVALWTASTKGLVFARPYVLPSLAVIALVPSVWPPSAFVPNRVDQPAFFAHDLYKGCTSPGSTLVVFTGSDDALIWQAQAGFRFNLAQGGLQPTGTDYKPLNSFDRDPFVQDLAYVSWAHPTMERLLAFAGAHGVGRVVSIQNNGYPRRRQLSELGTAQEVGDAVVAPACGSPPLTTRNLTALVARWEVGVPPSPHRPSVGWCVGLHYLDVPTGLVPDGAPHRLASFVKGVGLTCSPPPPGYTRDGYASSTNGVPDNLYPYYAPA